MRNTTIISVVLLLSLVFLIYSASFIKVSSSVSKKKVFPTTNLRGSSISNAKFEKETMSSAAALPKIIYGTAWKKNRTKDLVELAVRTGFRAIDTACQPKHYYEPGVGLALQSLYSQNIVARNDIFLQTKFTALRGQDPDNIPYDKTLPLREQVLQSFQVSCTNLKTNYVDSLVMHSPMERISDTLIVWKAFEEIHQSGGALRLGLSNTYDLKVLQRVYEAAVVKPSVLQNRFYRESGHDVEIRRFCKEHGIMYQSFWTLTGNPDIIKSNVLSSLARKYNKTREQIFFKFVQSQGIVPLSGTTSEQHMMEDLAVDSTITLTEDEIQSILSLL